MEDEAAIRMAELDSMWNNETDMEWRQDLSPEETRIVESWDRKYARGMCRLCDDILALEQNRKEASKSQL